MKSFTLTMMGTAPMLVHNAQLSDPLNKWAKEMKKVSAKRTKTEDDHLEMSRLEFYGGMYYDADLGPVIPAMNIEATLVNGAKKIKLGKAVTQGLRITDQVTPIIYKGPRDMAGLWGNGESEFVNRASVKVGMARVMRTRPMFTNWALEVSGVYDESIFDEDVINEICQYSGTLIGIGDWRPRFGTFTHELEVK